MVQNILAIYQAGTLILPQFLQSIDIDEMFVESDKDGLYGKYKARIER